MAPSPPRFGSITKENDLIEVAVGPDHTKHYIHKAVLVHHSDCFRTALKGCWTEGKERKVVIEDVDPVDFGVFVDWLYTGKIPHEWVDWFPLVPEYSDEDEIDVSSHLLMLKTYVLADRLAAREFLQIINNHIVDESIECAPCYRSVIYAFENIPSDRPILTMLVDTHCIHSNETDEKDFESERTLLTQLPYDFLLRTMQRYRQTCEDRDWDRDLTACDYHEYSSDEERKKCKRKAAGK